MLGLRVALGVVGLAARGCQHRVCLRACGSDHVVGRPLGSREYPCSLLGA
jgi:hypothetical protein